jgi:hypothetical protein
MSNRELLAQAMGRIVDRLDNEISEQDSGS